MPVCGRARMCDYGGAVTNWMRIGEVAKRTGLTVRTLRHYDELGLLVPSGRSAGDYRLYGPGDLSRLLDIQHLKSLGLSLDEVAAALDDPEFDAVEALARHIAVVEERVAAERELLSRLRALRDSATSGWEDVVDAIAWTERLRHPDSSVRLRAALDSPPAASLELLLDGLDAETEPGVREMLTWSIAKHGAAAVPDVVARLSGATPAARLQLTHVLSKLRDPGTLGVLADLLADSDEAVRVKAAFGLGQLGTHEAAGELVGSLATTDEALADAVVSALGRIGTPAVGPLVGMLQSGAEATTRARAADALGVIGSPLAVPALSGALEDTEAAVRWEALLALNAIEDAEADAAVVSASSNQDPDLRALAVRLLAR